MHNSTGQKIDNDPALEMIRDHFNVNNPFVSSYVSPNDGIVNCITDTFRQSEHVWTDSGVGPRSLGYVAFESISKRNGRTSGLPTIGVNEGFVDSFASRAEARVVVSASGARQRYIGTVSASGYERINGMVGVGAEVAIDATRLKGNERQFLRSWALPKLGKPSDADDPALKEPIADWLTRIAVSYEAGSDGTLGSKLRDIQYPVDHDAPQHVMQLCTPARKFAENLTVATRRDQSVHIDHVVPPEQAAARMTHVHNELRGEILQVSQQPQLFTELKESIIRNGVDILNKRFNQEFGDSGNGGERTEERNEAIATSAEFIALVSHTMNGYKTVGDRSSRMFNNALLVDDSVVEILVGSVEDNDSIVIHNAFSTEDGGEFITFWIDERYLCTVVPASMKTSKHKGIVEGKSWLHIDKICLPESASTTAIVEAREHITNKLR